jgi:hypothetical protein
MILRGSDLDGLIGTAACCGVNTLTAVNGGFGAF